MDAWKQQSNTAGARKVTKKVDITTNENLNATVNAIKKLGAKIADFSNLGYPAGQGGITAYVPLNKLPDIAANPNVLKIDKAAQPSTNGARIDGEGRVAHEVDQASKLFKVDGSGIKIGIISDSIDNQDHPLRKAYATGAISKTSLHILHGQAGDMDNSAEGLAMAEIIHAIAPKASIYFAEGFTSETHMGTNIRALLQAGCRIIVDDVTYSDEPPFQDGIISAAVSDVTAKGVLYFSSAGNIGSKKYKTSGTWEGDFVDGGPTDIQAASATSSHLHAFDSNITSNAVKLIDPLGSARADLFWADPLAGAVNQYNLYVVDAAGHLRTPAGDDIVTMNAKSPHQHVDNINDGDKIIITKAPDAAPVFLHLSTRNIKLQFSTGGGASGHNASGASNAFSVAAVSAPNPPKPFTGGPNVHVEDFSADGPRRMFFFPDGKPMTPQDFSSHGGMVFEKPDIAAADQITTSFPMGDGLNPFGGTSAAAPQAAAIAALLWSYYPKATAKEIGDILTGSALAVDGDQGNSNAGKGVVMAFRALQEACQKKGGSCPPAGAAVARNAKPQH